MAPMEGITGYLYRNAHRQYFPGIERYYTPFLAPHRNRSLKGKELRDVLPENNREIPLIPQILTNQAEDFIRTAKELRAMGYEEVNLNLGCPSGTVVSKHKGAGFLADPILLDEFLSEIYEKSGMEISIKTRIGIYETEEFQELLEVFNRYPVRMLIIHARLLKDYYKNAPHLEIYRYAIEKSKNPLCYNGNLLDKESVEKFRIRFPQENNLMLGRGIIKNPALHRRLTGGQALEKKELKEFHDRLLSDYTQALSGDKPVLFKMKELWSYMLPLFEEEEKYAKSIRKAERLGDYKAAVERLFTASLRPL